MALKSQKQKMFVQEYLIDLNATQAAIRAGYAPKRADATAYNLLRNTEIQIEIQKAMEIRSEKTGITTDKVLIDIDLIKQDAMSKNEKGKMTDRAAALKACELEGRHLKMFVDKIDMNVSVHEDDLEDLA